MSNLSITEQAKAVFEDLKHSEGDVEYWSARELMPALGYRKWERFDGVIDRAQVACFNSGFEPEDHFPGSGKTSQMPNGGAKTLKDYHLSRYACYLVAQNGDPRKPAIAAAQSYFAIKTREAETVIPAQQYEIEKLKLELELARAQERTAYAKERAATANERLAASTHVLALINPSLPALAFGKPDAVVEVERSVTVVTDAYGRSERYDGATITELAKRYGFGKGRKANQQCREWLRSVGIRDEDWIEEPAAHVTKKLPRELMRRLDDHFYGGEGERQRNLGEGV